MNNRSVAIIYDEYLERLHAARRENRFGYISRILTGRQDEACLEAFDKSLMECLGVLASEAPDSREVRELSEWMLGRAEAFRQDPYIKYSLTAVLRHLIPLTAFLTPGDAALLAGRFEGAFPRRERFPALAELIARLNEKSR